MRLLITGALGHIGSRLIRVLPVGVLEQVYLLDNLSTQRYPSLFDLSRFIPFRFIEEDILTADLEARFKGIDAVVHLAAMTNAEASLGNPEAVERTNLLGTRRVAEACAANGAKLVFISSTSVYGVQDIEVDETCPVEQLKPQSPYAHSKLKAEFLLKDMGASDGLEFAICRFGTIFGTSPGMRFHTAVNKFVWQACNGLPVTVWSSAANQKRPYLALEDSVRALLFILEHGVFDRETYNVVTANATVQEIVELIRQHVPDLSVKYVDSPIMNQLSYAVSSQRFMDKGFTFEGSLESGIKESVELWSGLLAWEA